MAFPSESVSILLVDDDESASRSLQRSLETHCPRFSFFSCQEAKAALRLAKSKRPSAAVVDLTIDPELGPESGLNLISELLEFDPTLRVVVLTGHQADEFGIQALQRGAASFLEKPARIDHLSALLTDAAQYSTLLRDYFSSAEAQPQELAKKTGLSSKDSGMNEVLSSVYYASQMLQPVLITGETGTGKGIIAQAIHRLSRDRQGPFIRYQPSFTANDLTSSELFGHKKGSFTGAAEDRKGLIEEADRGTLFIDEVDELPKETQVMLLNVLQEKTFRRVGENRDRRSDFRLLLATNQPLEDLTKKQKLRSDFYHRVAHFQITLPPLRDRLIDLPDIANKHVCDVASREALAVRSLSAEALTLLCSYSWPGNIRELLAVVEGGVYRAHFAERALIMPEDIVLPRTSSSDDAHGRNFRERVQEFESSLVRDALRRHKNNQTKAAESLGLDRSSFRRILQREEGSED